MVIFTIHIMYTLLLLTFLVFLITISFKILIFGLRRYFLHTFGSARVLPLRFVPRAWYNFNIHNNQWRTTSIQSTDTSTHRKTWKCCTDLPGNHRPRICSHGKEPRTTKGGLRLLQENSSRKLDTDRSKSYKGTSVFIPATTNHVTYFDHGVCVWR